MKSIAIVGTVGIPACYGGFESLVENLTLNASENIQYTVFCSEKNYETKKEYHNKAKLEYIKLSANGIQSVFYDIMSMIKCLSIKPDVVLILGVSGCLFLPIFKLLSKSKIVTNIDGLEWKRDKWGKLPSLILKWSENMAVRFSDVIVSDNQAISDYVLKEYSIKSQTIAYGGDHAIRNIHFEKNMNKYSLGLCRIEPENNVELILDAYSELNEKLIFIGNWDSSDYGINLKEKYSHFKNIQLLNPIYDLDQLYVIRKGCSLYIHGHSAGGTNPSLVEMMHFGVPIVSYDCNFNRFSTSNCAHYFSNKDELKKIVSDSNYDYKKNADKMKEIALRKYTWRNITNEYERLY